jgi:hypothetical protein
VLRRRRTKAAHQLMLKQPVTLEVSRVTNTATAVAADGRRLRGTLVLTWGNQVAFKPDPKEFDEPSEHPA